MTVEQVELEIVAIELLKRVKQWHELLDVEANGYAIYLKIVAHHLENLPITSNTQKYKNDATSIMRILKAELGEGMQEGKYTTEESRNYVRIIRCLIDLTGWKGY
jgi:hypothetical protein